MTTEANAHDRVGPLLLELEEGDSLGLERAVTLAARGLSTEHSLGPAPAGAEASGLAGLLDFLRVLLCREGPDKVPPLALAPILAVPDLDVLCLQTVQELLSGLLEPEEEEAGGAGDREAAGADLAQAVAVWRRGQSAILEGHLAAVRGFLESSEALPANKRRRLAAPLLQAPGGGPDVPRLCRPTPGELAALVAANRPAVLTGLSAGADGADGGRRWPLRHGATWSDAHLLRRCGERTIPVRSASAGRLYYTMIYYTMVCYYIVQITYYIPVSI